MTERADGGALLSSRSTVLFGESEVLSVRFEPEQKILLLRRPCGIVTVKRVGGIAPPTNFRFNYKGLLQYS
jgi:hypothetical protein